jgi:hypothetical protein
MIELAVHGRAVVENGSVVYGGFPEFESTVIVLLPEK